MSWFGFGISVIGITISIGTLYWVRFRLRQAGKVVKKKARQVEGKE